MNPGSSTGSIHADPAVQADAAARHRGDVARRVVGLVETDKATMGFETPEPGYVAKAFVESEEVVAKVKDFEDDGSSLGGAKPQGCNSIYTLNFGRKTAPHSGPNSVQAVALGCFQGCVKIFFRGSTFSYYFALPALQLQYSLPAKVGRFESFD